MTGREGTQTLLRTSQSAMRPMLRRLVVVASLLFASVLNAAEGGFIATLSEQQQTDAGLIRLSAEQQLALNRLVAREVGLARQGGVTAFAGTFLSRRKPEERAAAGLDQLTAAERDVLNQAVAAAIAAKPVPVTLTRRLRDKELAANRRLETRGEVTFVYGRGSGGRDLVGGSVYTEVYDRETGISLGVGVSRYEGNGWWGYPYDFYDVGYGYAAPVTYLRPVLYRTGSLRGGPICGPRR